VVAQRKPNASQSETQVTQHWRATAAVILLFTVIFGFLAVGSFTQQSPTIDEPIHLLGGYSYLKWRDYRINPEHPPLAKAWAALPLLWLNIEDSRSPATRTDQSIAGEPADRFYSLAHDMFFVRNDAATLFFLGKLQMVLAGALLGLFIYLWSRELVGFAAGVISLFVFALDPNILAHSTIIHTDLPFAAIYFIGTYFFWRLLQDFNRLNLVATAICLGFAVLTKYTYIWVFPAWLILALLKIVSAEPLKVSIRSEFFITNRWTKAGLSAVCFLGCAVVAYVMLWSAYGFRFSAAAGDGQSFQFNRVVSVSAYGAKLLALITRYHLLPEAWAYGHFYVLSELSRNMYFLGEVSNQGFWTYFPVAFLVKTPLSTVIIAFAAIWAWLRNSRRRMLALVLLIPAAVYFVAAVTFRLNIGVRHLLPVYPFLFVLIGGFVSEVWRDGSRIKRGGLVCLAIWYLWSSLSVYPHQLSYFNELAGGPKNGHRVLLDSNLDWGQDLKGLKSWMDQRRITQVQLAYFGAAEPKYYGIDDFYSAENLARWMPAKSGAVELPEYLVVSANFLYGGELFLPNELAERFERYKSREPVASIGYSLLVFKLNPLDSRIYEDAAVVTARKGAFGLTEGLLHEALRYNPASADAYYQLGALMARQNRLAEAIRCYRASINIGPLNDKAHFSLANTLIRDKQFDEATNHYRKALRIRPGFAEAYHNLGRVLAAQGKVAEAAEYFHEALRAKPQFAEAHESLGQLLAGQGRTDEAAQHYHEALRILKERQAAGARAE
jgi:tetratricopeptide (TPR) repeat protein